MLQVKVYTQQGESKENRELNPKIFGIAVNQELIQQSVVSQLARKRKAIAHTKTRGEVRGGGIKPWKQKGTGRARHGSIRSPLWVGGGIVFGPRNTRNFSKSINKKAKVKALCMALSDKAREQKIILLDAIAIEKPKTKIMAGVIKKLPIQKSALFIMPKTDMSIIRSIKNIPRMGIVRADSLNIIDVMKYNFLVILEESLNVIESTYLL